MKKKIKKILIIEFVLLVVYLIFGVASYNKEQVTIEIPLDTWESSYVEFNGESWCITPQDMAEKLAAENVERARWGLSEKTDTEVNFLSIPRMNISKGDYTVTVWYECSNNQSFKAYHNGSSDGYVKSSEAILDKASNMVSCDIRVAKDIDDFQIKFRYDGNGELSIFRISIHKNNNDLKRNFIKLMMVFFIVNYSFYYHISTIDKKKYLLAISGITILTSMPLFYNGLDGHDLIFHLNRIDGIARELSYGNFPVRIQSVWLAEYGYPVSIFYGDVLLYIPAVFRMFGFSIDEAYKLFVLIINLASVLIAEQSLKRIFPQNSTVLLLTLLYVTATYRLTDVYVRGAVGEYTALMFLPLIALAVYNIYCAEENACKKNSLKNGTIMAVGMAGIITSHVLTAEIVAFTLLIVCVVCWKKTVTWNTIRTYVVAIVETLLLSAGFLIPFVDYYLNVPVEITNTVSGTTSSAIQAKGAAFSDFFVFFSNPFGNWQRMGMTPGIVLMLALLVAVFLWGMQRADKRIKTMTVLSAIVLFMSTNLFPWDNLAYEISMFNMLAQVQFPWRFVGIAILMLTLLAGFVLENPLLESYIKISIEKMIFLCTVVTIAMTFLFVGYYADNLERNVYYDTANLDTWDIMGEEYKRVGTSTYQFQGEIQGDGLEIAEIISRKGCEMNVQCKSGTDVALIVLPVINHKGYEVTDNKGKNYEVLDDPENNLVSLLLPANFEGTISLRFVEPWYWTSAFAVSMITIVIISLLYICRRIKQRQTC